LNKRGVSKDPEPAALKYRWWVQISDRTLKENRNYSLILDFYTEDLRRATRKAIKSPVFTTAEELPSSGTSPPPGTNHLAATRH
jgi:hypothetical protein